MLRIPVTATTTLVMRIPNSAMRRMASTSPMRRSVRTPRSWSEVLVMAVVNLLERPVHR